jgi:hypothetical protein
MIKCRYSPGAAADIGSQINADDQLARIARDRQPKAVTGYRLAYPSRQLPVLDQHR